MSDKDNEIEIEDLVDSILQKNMKELAQDEEDKRADELAAHRERMMIERAKKDAKEQINLAPESIETDLFSNGEKKPDAREEDEKETPDVKVDVRVIEVDIGEEDDLRFTMKDLISILMYVGVIFVLTFCIVTFVGQRTRVSGSSMESTLSDGDNLLVDKLSYELGKPERFDIVIFEYQYAKNTYYIKRIIGLPGETVQIDYDGKIYINGEVLEENYGLEPIADPGRAIEPITLGPDEYFVLGDNRNNSSDSRFDGVANLNKDLMVGKAFMRIYPFDAITRFP